MFRPLTLAALLAATAPLAQAADNGIYLGAGYTETDYGLGNPGHVQPFDKSDHGYKLIAGFRPLDRFGVEVNYIDHGTAVVPTGIACVALFRAPCPDTTHLTAQTLTAFAVGYVNLPLIDLFAKAGATSWQFDSRTPGFRDFNVNKSNTDFAWGAGIQARFGSLGARLEYENFQVIRNQDLDTVSLSFIYTFL
jgi:opacity protein-like surface antigen